MGMFDYVNVAMDCPVCGNHLNQFQSKEHKCALARIDPDQVDYFYDICDKCGNRTILHREARPAPECRNIPFTREECEALGFTVST